MIGPLRSPCCAGIIIGRAKSGRRAYIGTTGYELTAIFIISSQKIARSRIQDCVSCSTNIIDTTSQQRRITHTVHGNAA
jgi:hypothetical protein